jgi:DNA-binding NarL/FixJ family response regulator
MAQTAVLIADSRPIVRRGLGAFLDSQPGLEMVGEAESGEQLVELAAATDPDVILLDLALSDGRARTVSCRPSERARSASC